MIKRIFLFLLVIIAFPLTAKADLIAEPNNDFYYRHSSACKNMNRSFYANGEGGSISLKEEPGSKKETAVIENGKTVNIMFTYDHWGVTWGVAEIHKSGKSYTEWPNGWVPMSDLLLVYDYMSFAEEHQSEFTSYTGDYSELKAFERFFTWSWPGSGAVSGTMESADLDESFSLANVYTDSEGRDWGLIGYWRGYRNTWICLSDPTNSGIAAFNAAPEPELWQAGDDVGGMSAQTLVIILVGTLAVGTAVLIRLFWKPKKSGS